MFLRNKNRIYVIAAIVICIGALFVWFLRAPAPAEDSSAIKSSATSEVTGNFKEVKISGSTIRAELATTEAEQVRGLSGRSSLASSTGMLFVFDRSAGWGIWMKDMNFPIDVLWITDDLKVSDMVENMPPESYPKVYAPHVPARYVLEVPAGTIQKTGMAVGQDVIVK